MLQWSHVDVVDQDMVVVVFVLLASSLNILRPRRLGADGLAMESALSSFVAIVVDVRRFFPPCALWSKWRIPFRSRC